MSCDKAALSGVSVVRVDLCLMSDLVSDLRHTTVCCSFKEKHTKTGTRFIQLGRDMRQLINSVLLKEE